MARKRDKRWNKNVIIVQDITIYPETQEKLLKLPRMCRKIAIHRMNTEKSIAIKMLRYLIIADVWNLNRKSKCYLWT